MNRVSVLEMNEANGSKWTVGGVSLFASEREA